MSRKEVIVADVLEKYYLQQFLWYRNSKAFKNLVYSKEFKREEGKWL
jgi:hypothetical protein